MDSNLDITGAFKVGSWLISVDTHNREQLLKTCQDWRQEHTDLLVDEIDSQLNGDSIVKVDLVRTSRKKLIYASVILQKYKSFSHVTTALGLNLIE